MLAKLFLSNASRTMLAKNLRILGTHRAFSNDLKKEFEELQKRLKQEKQEPQEAKKEEDKRKTMEELLKESKEQAKKQEEEMKQQFQEMKKAKTSLEFADIIKELKEKPQKIFSKAKNIFSSVNTKVSGLKKKAKAMKKTKVTKKTEEKKEEMKTEDKKDETPKEEIKVEPIEEIEEQPLKKKPKLFEKQRERFGKWCAVMGNKLEHKAPKFYGVASRFTKAFIKTWHETFPNQEDLIRAKMERVKQMAKEQNELEEKMKGMSEEEIKKIQESIPEHMRNALIIKAEEKKSEGGLWGTIAESDAAKKFKETKEYQEFNDVRQGIKDFTEMLKEELDSAESPAIAGARNILVF